MHKILAITLAAASGSASAQVTTNYTQPNFDRWNYPFNFTPGERTAASTFSSGNIPGMFDDRDAQFLNSFITAAQYTPGLGSDNYTITSATFTATLTGGEFEYDSTRNNGSSIELFGTGFRGGLNAFAYGDDFSWGFGDPTSEDIRNAYATDYAGGAPRDVSNEVRDGIVSNAFAIGQIAGEVPGSVIGSGQLVTFELDLNNPDVVSYLQDSLDLGIVSLSVSSLHVASQGGPSVFPVFGTVEGGAPATFSITAEVVPAPATATLVVCSGLLGLRRRR